ncbi:permease [Phosphitispora fastidiosa]|uniref:permease n=1 Tax=Phosphitispora fastidiosa TaxID=2837202 RepID=UPI001E367BB2|nr:permease [Phosphitispora fastidiosa]MBU7008058.1 uncharacterized membrane protein YraQ (UPF0718 family) [Phosphitispora fastidiosa]
MFELIADYIVYNLFNLQQNTRLGDSVHFFIYDSLKIIVLLAAMIFVISYIRSYFPPEKTKKILGHTNRLIGNIIGAVMGVVTPFCSCSSVPIFIGFVETGVPLGVTFSFLIASPLVNEISAAMLLGLFGWKVTLLYIASGMIIAIVGGIIIGKLKLEKEVEDYVYEIKMGQSAEIEELTWRDRVKFAKDNVSEIVRKIWVYILIGIGVGALIHGYAPEEFLAKYAGPDNPLAVFAAVIIGIPLYSNAVGTIPIAQALIGKGVGIGTALAFMMAVTALSLPEMIILRKVLKPKLIAIFISIVGAAIIFTGYLFNLIL